eukprot:2531211-Rhodomonas_salina.1
MYKVMRRVLKELVRLQQRRVRSVHPPYAESGTWVPRPVGRCAAVSSSCGGSCGGLSAALLSKCV